MPFVSFANTALVEMVFDVNSVICENTLYFRGDAAWNTSSLGVLGSEIFGWWQNNLRPLQGIGTTLSLIKCRDMSTQFGAYNEYGPVSGNGGTLDSPLMPNNVTCAIKFTSALVGRRNRGRNFFIGLTEGQVTGNDVGLTASQALITAYEDIQVTAWPNNGVHVIASRAAAEAPDWNGTTILVISYSMDRGIDTQRRRLV